MDLKEEKSTPSDEAAPAEGDTFEILPEISVAPYGVLGTQLQGRKLVQRSVEPDERTAFVDPAGLHHIQPPGRPGRAGGAAGAIYKFLGIERNRSFPEDVIEAVTDVGLAKLHTYALEDGREVSCIHVVGPNFNKGNAHLDYKSAVEALAVAYCSTLRAFAETDIPALRLLPISGGIFAGQYSRCIQRLTVDALRHGMWKLTQEERMVLCSRELYMCIFEEKDLEMYEDTFQEQTFQQ